MKVYIALLFLIASLPNQSGKPQTTGKHPLTNGNGYIPVTGPADPPPVNQPPGVKFTDGHDDDLFTEFNLNLRQSPGSSIFLADGSDGQAKLQAYWMPWTKKADFEGTWTKMPINSSLVAGSANEYTWDSKKTAKDLGWGLSSASNSGKYWVMVTVHSHKEQAAAAWIYRFTVVGSLTQAEAVAVKPPVKTPSKKRSKKKSH